VLTLPDGSKVEWELDRRRGTLTLMAEAADGEPRWLTTLRPLPDHAASMARMHRPIVTAHGLLLVTDAEHPRGATSMYGAAHFVDLDGAHRWTEPAGAPRVAARGDEVIVLAVTGDGGGVELEARRLRLPSGERRSVRQLRVAGASLVTTSVRLRWGDGPPVVEVASRAGVERFEL